MEAMKLTLTGRHLVPTAPHTLHSYPFMNNDPMVLSELPDVYLCGNADEFEEGFISFEGKQCRIVAIPKFSESHSAYVLDLEDYKVYQVNY